MKQFSKAEIEKIVRNKIESDEKLGDHAGGSGHMAHVSYELVQISDPIKINEGYKIDYEYKIEITTEFTYWPDNPPQTYLNQKSILINADGKIISELE